jgi:hypothetical protein
MEFGLAEAVEVVKGAGGIACALELGLKLCVGCEDRGEGGGKFRGWIVDVQVY